jgi:CHAT domain/Lecithin:cholesterol acyltransferase
MSITKMMVKGSKNPLPLTTETGDNFELKESYLLGTNVRGLADNHEISLKNGEVLELKFDDDTSWFCNADTIEDVFPETIVSKRSKTETFVLPASLGNATAERGIVGDVLLKAINVFTRKKIAKEISELAADLERKQLNNLSGLYLLDTTFKFQSYAPFTSDKPWLIFLHGTSSSTEGSFGELIQTELWHYIHRQYPGQVLAFEHETLTKSPLQNVLDMLEQLPQYASLHLISHSRGGLVGDIIARFCTGNEHNRGFDVNEINYLKKENRTADLKHIEAIKEVLLHKRINIGKFIRVACPASGTTLASGRMDNFFNMTFNLLGLATGMIANPAYLSFKSLLSAVINCKNDPDTLPGLEAMNPESAFIKVLNSPQTSILLDNPLAIISGNCKTRLNLKSLLIIASRLFFIKNNDLVVNTAAMYRGAQRETKVQYFFNEGTDVDHFHYFKNTVTQQAILNALQTPDTISIPGFTLLQKGAAGLDRNAVLKLEGGQVFSNTVTGTKPIAVVLPGIMGSNITNNDKLIWINYLRFLAGDLKKIDIKSTGVQAPSLIKTSYEKLVKYLQQNYDVVTFAFDWRMPLNSSAILFKEKIEDLLLYKQPIKIIGHSMGGVLVRDFMVTQRDTWRKLNATAGFRLVFLGSPLGGSFRIPFVLMGNDGIIDKLSKLDIFHSKKELLAMFSKFPGLLSLLPFTTDKERNFSDIKTWELLTAAKGDTEWPIPSATDLKHFGAYRDNILTTIEEDDFINAVYIAGKDKSTPVGYRIDDTANGKELVYLSTGEGDQSVTWETGIPKIMIEQNNVYYVNVSHGALSTEPSLFSGIEEILQTGATALFSKTKPQVRGTEKLFKTVVEDDHDLSPEAVEKALLGLTPLQVTYAPENPLRITVANGDLRYASYPLLVGHFSNDGITSSEAQVDKQLNFALSDRYQLGIYPGEVGSSEVFIAPGEEGFKGAVVVGLGALGAFTAYQLTQTVQQGVCKYMLDYDQQSAKRKQHSLGISAIIVGSGYGGLTIENAVRAIIQGVQNANDKIQKLRSQSGAVIDHIEFVELFEDAALSCFYSLRKIIMEEDRQLNIEINNKITPLLGQRRRILMRAGENWWNRITVKLKDNSDYKKDRSCFVYSASTGAARDLERDLYLSPMIIQEMLDEISTQNQWSKELAKTIFELLIPNDFKDQLKKRSNASWVVDNYTASYPWELLQDSISDAKPLCVNAGMIRQLSSKDASFRINTVVVNNALVVGDPFLDGYINQLPGAFTEAEMVAEKIAKLSFKTTVSLKEKSATIIKKLFSQDYKIIHLAGHGVYNDAEPTKSGMVIGKDLFLTTAEIAQLSSVPEFVFVNCCFLGKTEGHAEALYKSRYRLAASIGVQLISNGVKAVVVAGWAVDDRAALDFADHFYNAMFAGDNFGDAVKKARNCCFENHPGQNTWGAYQCYGDPFYKFDIRQSSKADITPYVIAEEAVIDLNNLFSEMSMGNVPDDIIMNRVGHISTLVDKAGIRTAAITEREAFIYAQLLKYDLALSKFDILMKTEQASFYVTTLETFCNTKAKKVIHEFKNGHIKAKEAALLIDNIIKELLNLLYISPTAERYNLLGSAHKRRAFVATTLTQKINILSEAAYNYQVAQTIAVNDNKVYPITNWYILESLLVLMGNRKWGDQVGKEQSYELPSLKEAVNNMHEYRKQLKSNRRVAYSYEEQIALVNIMLCEMILQPKLYGQSDIDELLLAYRNTWARVGSTSKKYGETEQLEIIASTLSLSTNRDVVKLSKTITRIKDSLEKLV